MSGATTSPRKRESASAQAGLTSPSSGNTPSAAMCAIGSARISGRSAASG
jgi:hypothetical protein